MLEAELLEHGRAIFGTAVLAVERHDAPGHQVVASEQPLGGLGDCRAEASAASRLAGPGDCAAT